MNNDTDQTDGGRNGARKMRATRAARKEPRPDEKRVVPHHLDAEKSVLGGIILQNEVLDRIDTLEADHFYDPKHQIVFSAIRTLQADHKPVDVVTLEGAIDRYGKLDTIGGTAFLGELVLTVPTPDNVVAYAKIIREKHLYRELMLKASDVVEKCRDWPYEAEELLGETIANLQQLERGYREDNERVPWISIRDSLDELERLANTPVVATPFPDLNSILGFDGLLSGQSYYLAGGTGFGKTSWLGEIAKFHATQDPRNTAFVAFYEMFAGYYTARMAARELGVAANRILRELNRAGGIAASEVERVLPPQIKFLDAPSLSLLRRAIEGHLRRGHPPPLVVVDYIQLLANRIMETMTRPDARLANAMASEGLRSIAKDTGAVMIIVSAASRSIGKKLVQDVRKLPARDLIDAAKESGAIEYDGAGVIVLSVSDEKDGYEQIATMSVAKARFGETHHIDARYDGRFGSWREIGRVAITPKGKPDPTAVAITATSAIRDAVLRTLRKAGPQSSKTKIATLSGRRKDAVLSEVDAMLDEGVLEYRTGKIAITGERSMPVDVVTEKLAQTAIEGIE